MDSRLGVAADELDCVFGNLRDLAALHAALARDISADRAVIVAALAKSAPGMAEAYPPYVRGLDNALYTLESLKKSHRPLRRFLAELERALGDGQRAVSPLGAPDLACSEILAWLRSLPASPALPFRREAESAIARLARGPGGCHGLQQAHRTRL